MRKGLLWKEWERPGTAVAVESPCLGVFRTPGRGTRGHGLVVTLGVVLGHGQI